MTVIINNSEHNYSYDECLEIAQQATQLTEVRVVITHHTDTKIGEVEELCNMAQRC